MDTQLHCLHSNIAVGLEQPNWATDAEILPHSKITFSQAVEKRGHNFSNGIFSHKITSYGLYQWIMVAWQCSRIYLRKNKIDNSRLRFHWHIFIFFLARALSFFCLYLSLFFVSHSFTQEIPFVNPSIYCTFTSTGHCVNALAFPRVSFLFSIC